MESNTNSDDTEMPSNLRDRVNFLHDSNKGVIWVISTLIVIFLGGGVVYKMLPLAPEEIKTRPAIGGNNSTIVINQIHPIATNTFKIITPVETSEEINSISKEDIGTTMANTEIGEYQEVSQVSHPSAPSTIQDIPLKRKPDGNILLNGDFSNYYEPSWISYQNRKDFSRIKLENQTLSLSYSGEGTGDREVSVQQTAFIDTLEDLMFSTTIKISDRNSIGYAIAKVSLFNRSKKEIFHISITPDSLYESKENYKLVSIPFNDKETVRISIDKVIKSKLPIDLISSVEYITVSYEISPPRQVWCKRCTISIYDSQLFYVKEKI